MTNDIKMFTKASIQALDAIESAGGSMGFKQLSKLSLSDFLIICARNDITFQHGPQIQELPDNFDNEPF